MLQCHSRAPLINSLNVIQFSNNRENLSYLYSILFFLMNMPNSDMRTNNYTITCIIIGDYLIVFLSHSKKKKKGDLAYLAYS